MRAAIVPPVMGLLIGAALGLAVAEVPHAGLMCAGLFAAVALATIAWRPVHPGVFAGAVALSFASGEAALAVRAWQDAWRPTLRTTFEQTVAGDDNLFGVVTGRLTSDAAVRGDQVSLPIEVQSLEIRGRGSGREQVVLDADGPRAVRGGVIVSVGGAMAPALVEAWCAGRTLRLPVRLHRPSRHLDPGVPDEERALARRGVILVGSVKSAALVEVLTRGSLLQEIAAAIRAYTRRMVTVHVGGWSPQSSAIVTAILIGDRAGLSDGVERSLQEAGTYHVIAISGGNIAILATLTIAVFRSAGMLGRPAMLAAIAGFLAYGAIVQGGASVNRALVTAVLYFSARALDHRVEPLHGLAVAAGLLAAWDPLSIADPGFLLSFGATAGIVFFAPAVGRHSWSRAATAAASLLLASAAAELALLPIAAVAFERITLAGLALNFAAIPAMAVAQTAGMLLVPVSLVSRVAADALGGVAALSAAALVRSAEISWVPLLSWRVPRPAAWSIAAYYSGLLAWAALRSTTGDATTRVRAASRAGPCVTGVAGIWIAFFPWTLAVSSGDGRLHVTFIDVGQGDAALIRFPRGTTLLVDAGGGDSAGYDLGDRVVGPVMREMGVRRLDTLLLSHPDADHVGGAGAIVRDFGPRDVWDGIPVPHLKVLDVLHELAADRRVRWVTVQRNDRTLIEDVDVLVHHPALPDWERQQSRNDDSVVIELRWRDVSIVFSGDIGREAEDAIADRLEPAPLRILKVPHHGSRSSSSAGFLERLQPRVAIISAGRGNVFGHPAPEVIERYRSLGTVIFRTDEDGAVSLDTDGSQASFRGFTGRAIVYGR